MAVIAEFRKLLGEKHPMHAAVAPPTSPEPLRGLPATMRRDARDVRALTGRIQNQFADLQTTQQLVEEAGRTVRRARVRPAAPRGKAPSATAGRWRRPQRPKPRRGGLRARLRRAGREARLTR